MVSSDKKKSLEGKTLVSLIFFIQQCDFGFWNPKDPYIHLRATSGFMELDTWHNLFNFHCTTVRFWYLEHQGHLVSFKATSGFK